MSLIGAHPKTYHISFIIFIHMYCHGNRAYFGPKYHKQGESWHNIFIIYRTMMELQIENAFFVNCEL